MQLTHPTDQELVQFLQQEDKKAFDGGSRGDILIEPNSCYPVWTAGFQTLPSTGTALPFHAFNIRYHANRWSSPLVQ